MNVYDLNTPEEVMDYAAACISRMGDEEIEQLAIRSLRADPKIWNAVVIEVARALGTHAPAEAADYLADRMKEVTGEYFWQSLAVALIAEIN